MVGRAEELRAGAEPLADADAEAYGAFMAQRTEESVERIVAVPFELVAIAAEVAELAALVAVEGNPNVSGDAAAGADLAAAVASIAARLVEINARAGDERAAERAAVRATPRRRRHERPFRTCPRDCPWDTSRSGPHNAEIPAAVRSSAATGISCYERRLDGDDVEGLGALLALACLELHLCALGEGLEALAADAAVVDEEVLPPSSGAMKP